MHICTIYLYIETHTRSVSFTHHRHVEGGVLLPTIISHVVTYISIPGDTHPCCNDDYHADRRTEREGGCACREREMGRDAALHVIHTPSLSCISLHTCTPRSSHLLHFVPTIHVLVTQQEQRGTASCTPLSVSLIHHHTLNVCMWY
jgi:hypothetical protein